eukprot:11203709-Lingulodinium_polyedra.AAC.1
MPGIVPPRTTRAPHALVLHAVAADAPSGTAAQQHDAYNAQIRPMISSRSSSNSHLRSALASPTAR